LLPGQQGCPAPPQVEQTDAVEVPLQTSPLPVQTIVVELPLLEGVVLQQPTPAAFPQRAQTPPEHLVPGDVQSVPVDVLVLVAVPVEQQGLPGPPQLPALQLPLLQVPAMGMQLAPLAMQMLETQQALFWQVLPEQQSWPGPPHAVPVTTAPPAPPPDPPLPEPPVPPLLPPPPAMTVPPAPVSSPPEPPLSSPPGPVEPLSEVEPEPLHPTRTTRRVATAAAESERTDDTRLCSVMGKLLQNGCGGSRAIICRSQIFDSSALSVIRDRPRGSRAA
jgi:hypothetical protein